MSGANQAERTIKKLKAQRDALAAELEEIKKRDHEAMKTQANLEDDLDVARGAIARLNQQAASLRNELEKAHADAQRLDDDVAAAKAEADKARAELTAALEDSDVKKLRRRLQEAKDKMEPLQRTLVEQHSIVVKAIGDAALAERILLADVIKRGAFSLGQDDFKASLGKRLDVSKGQNDEMTFSLAVFGKDEPRIIAPPGAEL